MTSGNSRQRSRRRHDRRLKERRTVDYEFGSPEWIAWVQQENMLWPKQDRRRSDRRVGDRRQRPRPEDDTGRMRHRLGARNLLSDEEKLMLAELMRNNHPD